MPLPLIAAAVGAGLGLLKSAIEQDNERKDRINQSITTRYSPWTGLKGREPAHTNTIGNLLQGASGGALFGQGIDAAASDEAIKGVILDRMIHKESPPVNFNLAGGSQGLGAFGGSQLAASTTANPWRGPRLYDGHPEWDYAGFGSGG